VNKGLNPANKLKHQIINNKKYVPGDPIRLCLCHILGTVRRMTFKVKKVINYYK